MESYAGVLIITLTIILPAYVLLRAYMPDNTNFELERVEVWEDPRRRQVN